MCVPACPTLTITKSVVRDMGSVYDLPYAFPVKMTAPVGFPFQCHDIHVGIMRTVWTPFSTPFFLHDDRIQVLVLYSDELLTLTDFDKLRNWRFEMPESCPCVLDQRSQFLGGSWSTTSVTSSERFDGGFGASIGSSILTNNRQQR